MLYVYSCSTVGILHRLSGTLPVNELLNSRMYFSFDIDPREGGILAVRLFESKYKNCNDDNEDNAEGMLLVSPHADSFRLASVDITPST